MVRLSSGILEDGSHVGGLQIRKMLQDFLSGGTGRQQVQYIDHANAHTPDTGAASTDVGIDRDSRQFAHVRSR